MSLGYACAPVIRGLIYEIETGLNRCHNALRSLVLGKGDGYQLR
jgi:hypothetical protein